MALEGRDIVGTAVQEQLEKADQSVDTFVANVQAEVKETTGELTETYGDAARSIVEDAMSETKSYAQSRLDVLSGFEARDLSSYGADGLAELSGAVSIEKEKYMKLGQTAQEDQAVMAHGKKVARHEEAHRDLQSWDYDLNQIILDPSQGEDGRVELKDLVEGQAIDVGGQTADELTPDYVHHMNVFQNLEGHVDRQIIDQALKTGEISRIQEEIIAQNHDAFVQALTQGNVAAAELQPV